MILGYASMYLVNRQPAPGLSEWLIDRAGQPTQATALKDVTLLTGASGLISPLWSLQWELLFSMLLPLFFACAVVVRRLVLTKVLLLVGFAAVGALLESPPLFYMPIFGFGVLLALELDRVRAWSARLRAPGWVALSAASLLALSAYWLALAIWPEQILLLRICKVLAVFGAIGTVLLVAFNGPSSRLFERRSLQWLGKISFSLYLVHEPIVVAVGYVVGAGAGWFVLPISLVLSLVAAGGFFWLIERPGHRLARSCSARFTPVSFKS
ncbi:peptidoglycan/LPS O-acetylase OafA/YrhL [Curtobacterium sp. 1310]|nr:peptidoglycan/LPS O-acetylase OafA/YrhL [Curtobacterium sp. 1310]